MSNPFSTKFVRPGAAAFIFPTGVTTKALVEKLQYNHWRGAIVGPHGCGKSTLIETLIPAIEQAGRDVLKVSLRDRQRTLPADFRWPDSSQAAGVIVVDGYEQLGCWARWRLDRACRSAGWGLLVTAHARKAIWKLPELYRVSPSRETFQCVVKQLLANTPGAISEGELEAAYQAHPENLREGLFALYDVVESRRRKNRG